MTGRIRRMSVVLGLLMLIGLVPGANASWDLDSVGAKGYAKAKTMPRGKSPVVVLIGRSATVTWLASAFPDGVGVDGYIVARYDANTGAREDVGSDCSDVLIVLTCTEKEVPPGDWKYAVVPRRGNWLGAESPKSSTISVASPGLSFPVPLPVTSLDATLAGTISNFVSDQTIEFRLGDPTTGPVLASTVTPNRTPASGTAAVTVTIPKGTSNGVHTVFAVGDKGDVAAGSVQVDVTPPTPTDLAFTNGSGPAGRVTQADTVTVTYSQRLDVGSLCSTWSGDLFNQSVLVDNAVTVRVLNDAASGNDMLDLTMSNAACGGKFNFGSIDLGSGAYVTADTTFVGAGLSRSTINWNALPRQLVITLGVRASGPNPGRVSSAETATYTPSAAIRNPSWAPITGTVSDSGVHF